MGIQQFFDIETSVIVSKGHLLYGLKGNRIGSCLIILL